MNQIITCADCGEVYYEDVPHACPHSVKAIEVRCDRLEAIVDRLAKNAGTTVEEILRRIELEDVP